MKTAEDFEATFLRWQDAERAVVQAKADLDRAVYLYLVGRGPAPTVEMADALADRGLAAMQALVTAHDAVRRCRSAIRIL